MAKPGQEYRSGSLGFFLLSLSLEELVLKIPTATFSALCMYIHSVVKRALREEFIHFYIQAPELLRVKSPFRTRPRKRAGAESGKQVPGAAEESRRGFPRPLVCSPY